MTARYIVSDVFDGLATLEDGSVDVVITSPPFLALRSYLPADDPLKAKEIGSEPTPAAFLDVMLRFTAELRRVLAPHGSIAIELGDTYSGTGDGGGDVNGSAKYGAGQRTSTGTEHRQRAASGWPLAKSKTLIPELYRIALAYGINPLTGQPSPAGQWRVRNVVTWARPNPPVGALGDKWRPATSDVVVACVSGKRYWDDLATRGTKPPAPHGGWPISEKYIEAGLDSGSRQTRTHEAGSPLLDYWEIPLDPDEEPTRYGPKEKPNHGGWPNSPKREAVGLDSNNWKSREHEAGAPLLDYWVIPPGGYNGQVATEWKRPVDPGESVGDTQRTTSADCPQHGDLVALVATAPHDGQPSVVLSPDNPDTGTRPVQGQLIGSEATDENPDRSGSSPSPTSASSPRLGGSSATSRSKVENRTALAPGSTSPGTPSAGTSLHTDGIPAAPSLTELDPDTLENRIEVDETGDSPRSQTSGRIADSDTQPAEFEACTCSYYVVETKYTSHYAVFPPELVVPLVKAMTPEKVCRVCGEPSRRITDDENKRYVDRRGVDVTGTSRPFRSDSEDGRSKGADWGRTLTVETLGWTDCGHGSINADHWRPGLVLDPFAGSGTTLLVATGHGHDAIGIDIDARNAELALQRVGPFLLEVV